MTRRSLLTLFMAFAMLWAISVTSLAGSGQGGYSGGSSPHCTDGCTQSVTWE